MYGVIRDRLVQIGINVIEEELDNSLGYCELSREKPVIHVAKNLDDMNKVSVLFHEAIHASSYWTKRSWWVHYRAFFDKRFYYMEEALALQNQIELTMLFGMEDAYSTSLAKKLYANSMSKLGEVDKIRIENENDKVNYWLSKTFKGLSDDLDRYFHKASPVLSLVRDGNLSSRMDTISDW